MGKERRRTRAEGCAGPRARRVQVVDTRGRAMQRKNERILHLRLFTPRLQRMKGFPTFQDHFRHSTVLPGLSSFSLWFSLLFYLFFHFFKMIFFLYYHFVDPCQRVSAFRNSTIKETKIKTKKLLLIKNYLKKN